MSRTIHQPTRRVPVTTLMRAVQELLPRRQVWGIAVVGLVLATAPSPALASTSLTANPDFPSVATVGDTDVPGSILLTNHNTGSDVSMTICSAGESGPCSGAQGITLTPSCGEQQLSPTCPMPDPGVVSVDSTARGTDGTSCAGKMFLVSVLDIASGKLRFAPTGGNVVLPTQGSGCRIEFTFDVLRFPARDALPQNPGTHTAQFATAAGVSNIGNAIGGIGNDALAIKVGPTIVASSSPAIVLGGAVSDSVRLAGAVAPVTGAVTFRLFGPNDPTCSHAEALSAVVPVSSGGTATSPSFTPVAAGTYRWIASYGGDANNNPVTAGCGEANQTVVSPPPPPPPPCSDCDGDGYPVNVDCNDGDATIHPGARDRPGNKRDEDCSGRDAPYERLPSRFSYDVLFYKRSTIFTTLHVRQVRAGSTIRVACTGKSCAFRSRTRSVKRSAENVNLSKLIGRTPLRPGTRLELRVTKPATIGIVRRLRIRNRLGPEAVDRCLPPGSRHATVCRL